jgi:excisionase family DNA binding protein
VTTTHVPRANTVTEAAAKVGVSAKTIRREIANGNLLTRRIRGCVRILDTELARWLEDYKANAS